MGIIMQFLIEILKAYHSSIATLLTGGVVGYLYYRAKKDEIRTAIKAVVAGELALRRGETRAFKAFLRDKFPQYTQTYVENKDLTGVLSRVS